MARKNTPKSDNSGSIHFDTRTKAVMAEVVQENIKEKVISVREVVPGKSNNEIVLVLQYYDYNVEKAIQAYLEDGAKQALEEWHFSGSKVSNKKKKKKNKPANQPAPSQTAAAATVVNHTKDNIPNGIVENGPVSPKISPVGEESPTTVHSIGEPAAEVYTEPVLAGRSSPELVVSEISTLPGASDIQSSQPQPPNQLNLKLKLPDHTDPPVQRHSNYQLGNRQRTHSGSHSHSHGRTRTTSEQSSGGGDQKPARRFHAGLEKSIKDLHRQTVSIDRLQIVLNEEVEKAYKRIKTVFQEMRSCLNEREVVLIAEMDNVKALAHDTLLKRQDKAGELKVKVDRSERMSEEELTDLRSEIKHFVTERKIDEDLARTTRFLYDSDHLASEMKNFGEIVPVKCTYSARRPSVSSVASSGPADDHEVLSPTTPTTAVHLVQSSGQSAAVPDALHGEEETHEIAELHRRLKDSLRLQGLSIPSSRTDNQPPSVPSSQGPDQSSPGDTENDFKKSRNAKRRQRARDRPQNGTPYSTAEVENDHVNSITEKSETDKSPPSLTPDERRPLPPRSGGRGRSRGPRGNSEGQYREFSQRYFQAEDRRQGPNSYYGNSGNNRSPGRGASQNRGGSNSRRPWSNPQRDNRREGLNPQGVSYRHPDTHRENTKQKGSRAQTDSARHEGSHPHDKEPPGSDSLKSSQKASPVLVNGTSSIQD